MSHSDINFIINGEITTLEAGINLLKDYKYIKGFMMGRSAYKNPIIFSNADNLIYKEKKREITRGEVIEKYISFIHLLFDQKENKENYNLSTLMVPLYGFFKGFPESKKFRSTIHQAVNFQRIN